MATVAAGSKLRCIVAVASIDTPPTPPVATPICPPPLKSLNPRYHNLPLRKHTTSNQISKQSDRFSFSLELSYPTLQAENHKNAKKT
jgi:hypothetical protein